ncbi:efflux RND transporter permease subunit [Halobacteriales archaeon Cl-PHB]
MIRSALHRCVDVVTSHNRLTLLVMMVLTVGVLAGIPQIDTASQAGGTAEDFQDVDRVQKAQYVEDNYDDLQDSDANRTVAAVYVRQDYGNVLSKEALLTELRFQQELRENDSLQAALYADGPRGIATLVARRTTAAEDPDLATLIGNLEGKSPEEVRSLVERTLTEDPRAKRFLPADHEGTSPTATDKRILVALDRSAPDDTLSGATAALYGAAEDRQAAGYFTIGEHALDTYRSHFFGEMVELVLPVSLLLILVVLAFSYRDLVDIVVGMTGVVLSVLWTFGLLGWLGVSAGLISIVPVVLVSGLSIDFGFHVFNRYREQRGAEEGIREPMNRGLRLVATALVLVTVTAAIGFLANLANPLPMIRELGVSITLGVVSAFVLFLTVVPALKVSVDGLLERLGLDRRKAPLGHGNYLRPLLKGSVWLARRAAPLVLVMAVVVGAAGGVAWTTLDEESFQQSDGDVAGWKQSLPQPIGWQTGDWPADSQHVEATYQPASADDAIRSRILVEGSVTDPDALASIHDGIRTIEGSELLLDGPGTTAVRSPVTAMQAVASQDQEFADALQRSDADGDGIPDRNLEALYDDLYAANPALASQVIERTDGEYRSVLVTLALDADYSEAESVVATLQDGADRMAPADSGRTATVVGNLAVNEAILDELVSGILLTMVLALVAIVLTLTLVFRLLHGSATLGTVVSVPIALVVGLVIGGMNLLGIPLTLLTALLMSLVVGLGVDYNIHVGDRFADELQAGKAPVDALDAAVTGTGGALLGSTLTSAGAFATITLVPHPQLQSFGSIVVVALVTAFFVSVLVLPSMLLLWARYGDVPSTASDPLGDAAATQD